MGDNRLPQLTRQPSRSRVVDQETYQKGNIDEFII